MTWRSLIKVLITTLFLVIITVLFSWLALTLACNTGKYDICYKDNKYTLIALFSSSIILLDVVRLLYKRLNRLLTHSTLVKPKSDVDFSTKLFNFASNLIWDDEYKNNDSNTVIVSPTDFTDYYYPVDMNDGSTEYVLYNLYYTWVRRVISLQNKLNALEDYKKVPFGQNHWLGKTVAGHRINRRLYESLVYLLKLSGATTPNNRRLRVMNIYSIIDATNAKIKPVKK